MPVFQSKTFRRATTESSTLGEKIGAAYRSKLTRHPFLLFGLPFIAIIVGGSFALTPAAALRYERYDRKVQQVSQDEAMSLGLKGPDGEANIKKNPRRRIIGDEREEYYVGYRYQSVLEQQCEFASAAIASCDTFRVNANPSHKRLMAKDLDNWDQKRVQRFEGEPDGKL